MIARGVADTDHPVLAHIVPIRRCNLACTYCNEFDDFSKPVPAEEMLRTSDITAAIRFILHVSPACVVPEIVFNRPGGAAL